MATAGNRPRRPGLETEGIYRWGAHAAILHNDMSKPLVHILVINWNGIEHLRECFDSLLSNAYPNARYILIDNASQDGSIDFLRQEFGHDRRVDIVSNTENLGWSRGNNVGLRRALDDGAEYVFLLNNDTATEHDAVERLVEAAEAHPEVGALAPKMLLYDNPNLINSVGIECSIIGNGWDLGLGRLDAPKWNQRRRVIGVCGGAAFFRTEALRRAGLLPEDFGIYLDDLDLSLRVWNAGFEIWTCPEAVVRHKFSATMGTGKRQQTKYYLNTRNRLRLVVRNFPVAQWPGSAAWGVVGEAKALGRAALDGEWWRLGAHARAWCAAAACAPGDIAHRWAMRQKGLGACRFRHLLRTDTLFFPGVPLPEQGWYAPVEVGGTTYQPMSSTARRDVQGGRLRLAYVNCYPRLGCLDVDVSLDGKPIASLVAPESGETVISVEGGVLEFRANTLFDADETGEKADFGGWIRVDAVE